MKSVRDTPLDPSLEFVQVQVDDKTYKLLFDFNALAEAEAITKTNLLTGMWAFLTNRESMTAVQLRGILYASLRKAHPEMTIDDAGALIRLDTFAELNQAVNAAFVISMPEKKRVELGIVLGKPNSPTENSGSTSELEQTHSA
jgi:hypothetical protein